MAKKSTKRHIYIISGLSGSGKTTALRYIEELGFYCTDNLPAKLLNNFIKFLSQNHKMDKIAVVIDARGKAFLKSLETDLKELKKTCDYRIIFFESNLQVIIKRYKESRLKHPLSLKGSIKDGYLIEQKHLNSFRQHADLIINTSLLNVHGLKSVVQKYLLRHEKSLFEIKMMSFGFKYGLPQEADLVIDVRFLINPYFVPKLKNKNGKNKDVQKYIFKDKQTPIFINKTKSYLEYLIKQYKKEGKSYITIAFGCTGGKHRSIAIVEKLHPLMGAKTTDSIKIHHRDISES